MSGSQGVVRWGVVGTGGISDTVTPEFALTGNATVTGVASRTAASAEEFAARHGISKAFGSFGALLADDEIDAVYLGTPHAVHHAMALEALRAGKHVLIEKPMALNGAQAEEVFDLAAERGLFAMEAMWSDFSPNMLGVLETVRSGVIGEPRNVHAQFGAAFPRDSGSRWQAEMGGSTLLDQGIYPVALAQAVLGTPDSIAVTGSMRPDGVDLAVRMTCDYAGGAYAQLSASMVDFTAPVASIGGTSGWISIAQPFWMSSSYTVHSGGFPAAIFTSETVEVDIEGVGYTPMIRAASDAVLRGDIEHPLHSRARTLAVFAVLDAVRADLAALERAGS